MGWGLAKKEIRKKKKEKEGKKVRIENKINK